MSEPQIYGTWTNPETVAAISHQRMTLHSAQLAEHWRRCGLSADLWAGYTALFVAQPPAPGHLRRKAVHELLNFMLNELFENCAKFSGGPIGTVQYHAWVQEQQFIFQLTNHIAPAGQAPFAAFIQKILDGDPDELYFQRLEEQAETNAKGSGLGYLSMMKDYGVRFGFRFRSLTEASVAVDVQAHVSRQEI
jgi:hypothetical protein